MVPGGDRVAVGNRSVAWSPRGASAQVGACVPVVRVPARGHPDHRGVGGSSGARSPSHSGSLPPGAFLPSRETWDAIPRDHRSFSAADSLSRVTSPSQGLSVTRF